MCARYSIVRADGKVCSRCDNSIIYKNGKVGCKIGADIKNGCKIYGDTKEQMIKKVATVLRRNLKVDVCSYKHKGKMRKLETIRFKGKGRFDEIVIELEELAKKIVEFLGVE